MIAQDVPRTILGLTAESFWVGAFVLAVCAALVAGCYQDVKRLLAGLSAVRDPKERPWTEDRPCALPAFRQEAIKARTGGWTR